MPLTLISALSALGLFAGMVLLLEIGRRLGRRRQAKEEAGARAGLGQVEGTVFALMGLLVAFTFSGAATRFDTRRQLIVQEANAIGTAWLRLDLLSASAQPELRELFRRYLDSRLTTYQKLPDLEAANAEATKANALQGEIGTRATAACRGVPSPLRAQVIPALNETGHCILAQSRAQGTEQRGWQLLTKHAPGPYSVSLRTRKSSNRIQCSASAGP